MKFYLGVTDINWDNYLASQNRDDVNFWQPGGNLAFRVLTAGQPFLFKLKSPINAIAGVGFFSSHTHGGDLYNLPPNLINKPEKQFVEWHNENVIKK
jgi:hypothetical protein